MPFEPAVVASSPKTDAAGFERGEAELEFSEIFQGVWRRKLVVFAFVLLGLCCGLALAILGANKYTATVRVELSPTGGHGQGSGDQYSTVGDLTTSEMLNTEVKTQLAEITDDSVALAAVKALHWEDVEPYAIPNVLKPGDRLAAERGLPIDQAPLHRQRLITIFESRIKAEEVKGTRLLDISFSDGDPRRAADGANAVVSAYLAESAKRQTQSVQQLSGVLQAQLDNLRQKVEQTQSQAERYANENQKDLAGMTIASIPGSGRAGQGSDVPAARPSESVPVARLLALNSDLTNAQVATLAKAAIYQLAQSQDLQSVLSIGGSSLMQGAASDSSLSSQAGGLALLQRLRDEQATSDLQIATSATKYGAKSPVMIQLRNQQAALRTQIREEMVHVRERAKGDLEVAKATETALTKQVAQQEQDVTRWSNKADNLMLYQGEAASSRSLYQDIYARLQESQFAAGEQASRISIVDLATMPTEPSSPKRLRDIGLGLLVGLVLGIIAAFALESFDDSLYTEHAIRKSLRVPIVGVIPRFSRRASTSEPWVSQDPNSPVAEAYRFLRSQLAEGQLGDQSKVILVASAAPGEGKATTCLNTAAALALQGNRVLIVNADMRRKSTPAFSTSSTPGLSDLVAEKISLDQAIRSYPQVENLSVMSAGGSTETPSEMLSSTRFQELLGEMRARFDYIFIDSPPVLSFADAAPLSMLADGYILIVRLSRTSKAQILESLGRLKNAKAKFVGVVLNASEEKSAASAHSSY